MVGHSLRVHSALRWRPAKGSSLSLKVGHAASFREWPPRLLREDNVSSFRRKMVKENRRTAVYSEEMEQKVLELAEQPLLDIFLLIFDGGIRPQESLSLEWSDLLWDKNLIHVRGTKSDGSDRHVPMSDRVKQALRVRAQGAKGRFVFPAKHKKDAPLSYVAIAKRFTRLVSEVLGHASVLTTERHLHPSKRGQHFPSFHTNRLLDLRTWQT
jgi:integrase